MQEASAESSRIRALEGGQVTQVTQEVQVTQANHFSN